MSMNDQKLSDRDRALADLSELLGIKITRVIKVQKVDGFGELLPASYRLVTDHGVLVIPRTEVLTSRAKMRCLFFDRLDHLLPVKRGQWNLVLREIVHAQEKEV
jgi:hypothetical protein